MGTPKKPESMLEPIAWSALFIWWGISFIPGFLPNGLDAAGTGVILLGVNAARFRLMGSVNGFSLTAGILCLVWGGLDMMRSVFRLPYRPPVFAILLVVLGVIVLVSAVMKRRPAQESTAQKA